MNKYMVYITCGGVMEDPNFHDEYHMKVIADNPDEAIIKWLKEKNLCEERYLYKGKDGVGWSYYYPIHCNLIQ